MFLQALQLHRQLYYGVSPSALLVSVMFFQAWQLREVLYSVPPSALSVMIMFIQTDNTFTASFHHVSTVCVGFCRLGHVCQIVWGVCSTLAPLPLPPDLVIEGDTLQLARWSPISPHLRHFMFSSLFLNSETCQLVLGPFWECPSEYPIPTPWTHPELLNLLTFWSMLFWLPIAGIYI